MAHSLALVVVGIDGSEILPRADVDVSSSVGDLQRRIEAIWDKPVTHLVSPQADALDPSSLVGAVGLVEGSTLTAVGNTEIVIHVNDFLNKRHCVTTFTTMTLRDFWAQLRKEVKVQPSIAYLIDERTSLCYKEDVETDRTLWQCGFRHGSRLVITLPFKASGIDWNDLIPIVYDFQLVHAQQIAILVCRGECNKRGNDHALSKWRQDVIIELCEEGMPLKACHGKLTWDAERVAVIFTLDAALVGMQSYKLIVTSKSRFHYACRMDSKPGFRLRWSFSTTANPASCAQSRVEVQSEFELD